MSCSISYKGLYSQTFVHHLTIPYIHGKGCGVAKWLRRCATSRMVPGLIPGGVTGFFSDIFPSDRTMALESTQPLVKMSTRNIPGGKGGRCVRLTSPPSRAECHEIWKPKPPGTLWATMGLLRDSFTFTLYLWNTSEATAHGKAPYRTELTHHTHTHTHTITNLN